MKEFKTVEVTIQNVKKRSDQVTFFVYENTTLDRALHTAVNNYHGNYSLSDFKDYDGYYTTSQWFYNVHYFLLGDISFMAQGYID